MFQHELDHLDGRLLLDLLDATSASRPCATPAAVGREP